MWRKADIRVISYGAKWQRKKTDAQKLYSYDNCRIMSRIAYDYVDKVEDNLAKAREAFNTLFDTLKEQE